MRIEKERGIPQETVGKAESFRLFVKELKDWKLTVPLLFMLIGTGSMAHGFLDMTLINPPDQARVEKVERRISGRQASEVIGGFSALLLSGLALESRSISKSK